MNYNNNYSRCRQFVPPGWGTARMLEPCFRKGRPVQFRAKCEGNCRPTYQPIIVQAKSGINEAMKDPNIRQNPDSCHGRRFCPPSNQAPINVHLNMCPVPGSSGDGYGGGNACMSMQANYGGGGMSQMSGQSSANQLCQQCPNTCPMPRCPPGVKVERTLPIIPARRLHESFFKMPSTSVYKSDYVERKGSRTPSFAPERLVVESHGDFQQESLTKVDYKPHPVCPYKKPPWAFRKPREENNLRMNGISSYKSDYVPKEGRPAPSAKPVRFIDADLPFVDDRTVYQIEFVPHCLPEKETRLKPQADIVNCVPFDGLTIYKRDYIPKRGRPAVSVVDKERSYARTLQPMEGTTTYNTSFGPFYFADIECIPAELYDQMYPPKDKCAEVRCFQEADRVLEDPIQPPVPPCSLPKGKPYCPSPYEMRCSPQPEPCVPSYRIKKESNEFDDSTVIRVEHNYGREDQSQPIEYTCPPRPCKNF